MDRYWIFTVVDRRIGKEKKKGIEIYRQRMSDSFWGIEEKAQNRMWIREGDHVVFYLGRSDGKKFLGTCTLASNYCELNENERRRLHHGPFFQSTHGVKLKGIDVWEKQIPIDSLVQKLGFISNKTYWQSHLQGSIREIFESDYLIILAANERNKIMKSAAEEEPKLTEESPTVKVNAKARDNAFREMVKEIYDYSCAVCGKRRFTRSNLPEIESAHIFPKGKKGKDDPRNGIALCRLHHWALDGGLFAIKDDFSIVIEERIRNDENYAEVSCFDKKRIRLPKEDRYKPHRVFLEAHRKMHSFK